MWRLILILLVLGTVVASIQRCAQREPVFRVDLSEGDAFRLASVILAHGKVRGCGDLKVLSQSPLRFDIGVECGNGRKHTLRYKPFFEVDGEVVSHTWLDSVFCVKDAAGRWRKAYIDSSDADKSAIAISHQEGRPTRVFYSNNSNLWITRSTSVGVWKVAISELPADPEERGGCEFEMGE